MKHKVKMGIGFDAHKFSEDSGNKDNHIILCGVEVPCKFAIIAHSDGDVALHALTDAILGSIAEGDIGVHFPPTDEKWKNVKSDQFVKFAQKLLHDKGGSINNIDITLICEIPKLSPYRDEFRNSLSNILNMPKEDISIKATTTEKMGFTGRSEGIACQAAVCVSF
ncbi:MAG: 2-C-methyl-D-erythritol 2,4-cyclodiphosphate synthase [Alphaproteobacteria bacterium]|nr:2-C-methyl-D-erythritol 2,4-cyclodiphosphate synthase [Alphaproteobacteria bacterium]